MVSARLFGISAYEPSSLSVCQPWLHLCRSQVWPWRGTWLAVTAIAEQVHHAPGETHTTYNSEKGWSTDIQDKMNNLSRARRQKSFAKKSFADCFQGFLFLCVKENSKLKNDTGPLHQLCFQNVGWVDGSVVWDFCENFHSMVWDILQQWDRKQAHEVVWIRALGTL